ncbi:SIN1-domain-containing protein [Backusella circina FSU 941]|nr:SIN1-domain-containing protein [Backusella circina FSU 941]
MSLITDPLYLIHINRIKFLRMDERGERIISFPPTVMSNDYVRLAAPIYPEIQYCYSPSYDSYFNEPSFTGGSKLTSSPRTTKSPHYRMRKAPLAAVNLKTEMTTDSEEDDIDEDKLIPSSSGSGKPEENASETSNTFNTTSLHPSVDSAIDPSPRSSIDDTNTATVNSNSTFPFATPTNATTTVDTTNEDHTTETIPRNEDEKQQSPLEYTKKQATKPSIKSALSALIAEKATKAENPFSEYSFVSGKGENKPITLCVYLPTSFNPMDPISLVVKPDAIIDDVIGYILYDYVEQKRGPELDANLYDLAEWVLLIAEDDGEIEDDLPALDRTRKIDRVFFDQFALCRATPTQVKQNDLIRAKMGRNKPDPEALSKKKMAATPQPALPPQNEQQQQQPDEVNVQPPSVILPPSSIPNGTMLPENNELESMQQTFVLTQPEPDPSTVAVPVPSSKATLTKATMPMTPLKYFRIKLMTNEEVSATTTIPVYAEMFIGDVLELVSRKRKLNPNEYMLMIADTNTIVPNDTTVESMKGITDLTLTKKGTALTIPSSSHIWRSPIKRKKDEGNQPMYFSTADSSTSNANDGLFSQYKKYSVSRKMPMFVSKRIYILAIDGDYIHLMPPEHKGMFDSVKTTSFHASAVRSCKQSKKVPTNFKIIILKERDFKTYDLEAENPKDAYEICARVRFLMQVTKGTQ